VSVDLINFAQDREKLQAVVHTVSNLRDTQNAAKFLTSSGITSFSRRTLAPWN